MQLAGSDRIVLGVPTPGGSEIDIFDTENGKLVGQIKVDDAR